MRVKTISRTIAAVVLTGALALTGCSKESSGTGTEGNKSAAPEEELGPLDKYFQAMWAEEEGNEETYKQQEAERQEFIAKCMTDLGWDYIPVPWQEGSFQVSEPGEEEGPAWGTLEFAKQYGYGIVSWPGSDAEPTEEPTYDYVDPNEDYVNSLSEAEREAYYIDLHGDWSDMGMEGDLDEDGNPIDQPDINFAEMGCDGKAYNQQQGNEQPDQDPEFKELFERMSTVWDTTGNSDIAAVEQEWSSCMSGKGFTFATREEATNAMYEKSNGLWGEEAPAQADLDAFQEAEIAQATADYQCAEDVKYEKRFQEINFALQQKFVDENRAQLDALVAKYGKKK